MLALVTIGVFGLFHPVELEVSPAHGGSIVIEHGGVRETLEGAQTTRIRSAARIVGRDGGATEFVLSVPGKIRREFHGRLEVRADHGALEALVEMDPEVAVASIVAAELPASAPLEAMKAQAVAARSFLAASHGRHQGYDFCDTTHCQFLREPPARGSAAARASEETRGLMLAYQGRVFAALYSADCGGHTRAIDNQTASGYPYFAVECPRRSGTVSGHGMGLCQEGAAEMARGRAGFREILVHFYPATTVLNGDPGQNFFSSSTSAFKPFLR